jgi:GGDEF domain-containing protein
LAPTIASNQGDQFAAFLYSCLCQVEVGLPCLTPIRTISEFVTISLGIVTATDHVLTDGDQLVALADQALYNAKNNGRNRYEVMTASI